MKEISVEQYLKEAVKNREDFVVDCVNVGLRKQVDDYFLRVIFPCSIYVNGLRGQKLYDLPYLKYCKFSYVVCETKLELKKQGLAIKIGKCLKRSQEFQTELGKVVLMRLLQSEYGYPFFLTARAIKDVIARYGQIKKAKIDVKSFYWAQAIEFSFSTGRITQLTAGGTEYVLPSKPLLKKISSKLHRLYLQEFFNPGSDYDKYIKSNQRDKKFEVHQPRGWMENGITPFYCGLTELNKEKIDLQLKSEKANCLISLAEVEKILSLVPRTISIPLFSFSIFSILKFFFAEYPSRISVKDSYQNVIKSMQKILFLSLEGGNEAVLKQIAELYCGTFLRHSLGGTPTRENESRYVHDGIIIYSENAKKHLRISEQNMDSYIVKDACALFVCIQLPMNAKPIRIKFEDTVCGVSLSALRDCRDKVDLLLQHFIVWLEASCKKRIEAFAKTEDYIKLTQKMSVDEERAMWKDSVSRTMKGTFAETLEKSKIGLARCPGDPAQKEKFAYLLSSFYIFSLYLSESYDEKESELSEQIRADGFSTLYNLYGEGVSTDNVVQAFSHYISYLFEGKAIILIRGEEADAVSGWFDPKRDAVFLPYDRYYEDFIGFCENNHFCSLPISKTNFQAKVLAKFKFIQLKQNGKGSGYFRADRRIQVSPISIGDAPKENVIEISLKPFDELAPLSPKAIEIICTLKKKPLRRRTRNL